MLLLLCSSGCVSLTPQGANIRLTTNPDVVRQCSFVRNIEADSTTWGLVGNLYGQPNGGDQQNAENALRNIAASVGADTVFVTMVTAWKISGEAYACQRRPVTSESGTQLLQRINTLLDTLADSDGSSARLKERDVRTKFMAYLIDQNPPVSQITYTYLQQAWFDFLRCCDR